MDDLKLIALDEEDLRVVSAHLQDAVVRSADIAYAPSARRFAMIVRRFNWGKALEQGAAPRGLERRLSLIRLEHVLSIQYKGLQPGSGDQVLNVLAIEFIPGEAPGGWLVLHFSGAASMRLEVDCIEGELSDLGATWETRNMPEHPE